MVALFIALGGLAAAVACFLNSKNGGLTIFSASVGGIIHALIAIWGLPTVGFAYPAVWFSLILVSIIGALIGLISDGLISEKSPIGFALPAGILAIFAFAVFFTTSEMLHSAAYRNVIGAVEEKVFEKDVPIVDAKHIRLVPKETALTLAKKVLGQAQDGTVLGSQLSIDTESAAIQEVDGELWWIMPLDFNGFFTWHNRGTVPGYIRVSAQDPTREAQLIDRDPVSGRKFELRFTRKAWFGSWFSRNVYFKYPAVAREDYTFEVDDDWRPYYVVSATYPTIGFSGYQTLGVIIVDPQSGEMTLKSGLEIPAWVDRVIPLEQARQQITWWGKYKHGWLNAIFAKRDVQLPTDYLNGPDLWFVKQGDRKFWFTGMTSASSHDQSLVGAMLMETRTGKTFYYPMQGTDENGVVEAADASLGADSARWQPAQPIPYNIYGTPTWVIPVISEEGIYQKVALVDMNNINTIVAAPSLEQALLKYRARLTQRGNEVAPTAQAGLKQIGPARVLRVGDVVLDGDKTYFLLVEGGAHKLFSSNGETKQTRLIAMVQPGDTVTLEFMETDEAVVPLEKIEVKGIELKTSPLQAAHDAQRKASKESEDRLAKTRDAEETWNRLSPEEKRKLIEQTK